MDNDNDIDYDSGGYSNDATADGAASGASGGCDSRYSTTGRNK